MPQNDKSHLPTRWPWLIRGFERYVRWHLRRKCDAVRLLSGTDRHAADAESLASNHIDADSETGIPRSAGGGGPVLVALNHPSWWDPLAAAVLAGRFFPGRAHYAPIDAAMLQQYAVFQRMGFFGVEPSSARGGAAFLRTATQIARQPDTAMWVTAQGRFTDVRQRPITLAPGLARLAARLDVGVVLPLAIELAHWDQPTPELLLAWGEPMPISTDRGADAWQRDIETGLTTTMNDLADASIARDPANFDTLLGGSSGVGGPYDWGRRLKAWARGQRFDPAHGARTRPKDPA